MHSQISVGVGKSALDIVREDQARRFVGLKLSADHLHSMASGFFRSVANTKSTSCPRLSRQYTTELTQASR